MPATLSYTGKLVSVIFLGLICLCASRIEYLPLLHIILNNKLITPNGIFVAPLREFLKYKGCSIILEGCNETPHNGVTELHNGISITLLGEYDR